MNLPGGERTATGNPAGSGDVRNQVILVVSHDASRTGAPIALLNLIRYLQPKLPQRFRIVLRAGGPLEAQFKEYGEIFLCGRDPVDESLLRDVSLIYSNTASNGVFIQSLPYDNIPILTHVHEMECSIEMQGQDNLRELQKQSTHYIACSKAVAATLEIVYGVGKDRISVVPEAVSPEAIEKKAQRIVPGELRRSLGIGKDERVVLGCGPVDLCKGVDILLQVAHYCKSRTSKRIHFLWIGKFSNEFSAQLFKGDLRKLGIKENVRLLGEMENPYPYFDLADLFCLPSREDSFPHVMLEAGYFRKPVLAFHDSGGAEEYCQKGGGFLVPYLDAASMGEWILSHIDDSAELSAAGLRGRKLVEEEYSLERTGPAFLDLVRKFSRPGNSASVGKAQLFVPAQTGYSEKGSIRFPIKSNGWYRLDFTFHLEKVQTERIVRLDPFDGAGVVEIAGLRLTCASDGRLLWKAEKPEEFDDVRVEGTAIRIPDTQAFRLLCTGLDPILYLPDIKEEAEQLDCRLEVMLRVDETSNCMDPHIRVLSDALRQIPDPHLQEKTTRDFVADLRIQLIKAHASSQGRDVLIWGTGLAGETLARALHQRKCEFKGFIDGDLQNVGKKLLGYPINTTDILAREGRRRPFIFIGSIFHREIMGQLDEMGFVQDIDYAISPLL